VVRAVRPDVDGRWDGDVRADRPDHPSIFLHFRPNSGDPHPAGEGMFSHGPGTVPDDGEPVEGPSWNSGCCHSSCQRARGM